MEFKQYRGKSILAWLSYNANYEDPHGGINNRCYVYPRVMNGANYDPIDSTDFPNWAVSKCVFKAETALMMCIQISAL